MERGVFEKASRGNQFATKREEVTGVGKILVMRSFTACTYSEPYIMGDEVKEECGTHETRNEYI